MALPKNETEMAAALAAAEEKGRISVQVPNVDQATAAAVAADRTRRQQIMALPEAEKRQKLATTMADGDYTVEQAKSLLGSAAEEAPVAAVAAPAAADAVSTDPKANPGETTSAFTARMAADKHPEITGNDLGGGDQQSGMSDDDKAAAAILRDQAMFTGAKHKTFGQKAA